MVSPTHIHSLQVAPLVSFVVVFDRTAHECIVTVIDATSDEDCYVALLRRRAIPIVVDDLIRVLFIHSLVLLQGFVEE